MTDPLLAALVTFGTVALAETGDKTQVALIILATRMSGLRLWAGSAVGFALVTALGVVAGGLVGLQVSDAIVRVSAALAMAAFGLWILWHARHPKEETEAPPAWVRRHEAWGPFAAGAAVGFVLEMGDKTQLAVVAFSARFEEPLAVFLGAWLALTALAGVGVGAGEWLRRRVRPRTMEIVSGLLFLLLAALIVWLP